jgi:hypothetical protein
MQVNCTSRRLLNVWEKDWLELVSFRLTRLSTHDIVPSSRSFFLVAIDIETAGNSTEDALPTQSFVGASGTGFVSAVAASQTSGSRSTTQSGSGTQQSQGAGSGSSGTNGSSRISAGFALLAVSMIFIFAA